MAFRKSAVRNDQINNMNARIMYFWSFTIKTLHKQHIQKNQTGHSYTLSFSRLVSAGWSDPWHWQNHGPLGWATGNEKVYSTDLNTRTSVKLELQPTNAFMILCLCMFKWAVVGDTYPVGCRFQNSIVFRDSTFVENPDDKNSHLKFVTIT